MDTPILWYLNRSTGAVVLVLLTCTLVLGLLSPGGRPARWLPRFVTQQLHRNLAMMSVGLLTAHVVTAVIDTYVDIRWWQAFSPIGATYEPFWLGLGAVSLDLMVVVVLSSLARNRMADRTWRLVHQFSWPMWVIALAHGIGMGTDLGEAWLGIPVACAAAVTIALIVRLGRLFGPSVGVAR